MIAIDFETYLIDKDNYFPKPVCVSSYNGKDAFLFVGSEMESKLSEYLDDTIIAHNAVFECGVIVTHFPNLTEKVFKALEEGRVICTLINEKLNNVVREKQLHKLSLAGLVEYYLDKDISDTKGDDAWRMRYSELDEVPKDRWPQAAVDYAIMDSVYAYQVYYKQPLPKYQLSVEVAVHLNLMASKGVTIDEEKVKVLEGELMDLVNPSYDLLLEKGFCKENPKGGRPTKKMKEFRIYLHTKGIGLKYTAKGGIGTTAEDLEYYSSQVEDPVIQAFQNIAKYEKILSAYTSRLKESNIIYTDYNPVVNTGRTSSRSSKLYPSVNAQQMPRQVENVTHDVRNCFKPRPGLKMLSIDYGGLELCSTSHQLYSVYGKSAMRDTINEGDVPTDMHSKLAARIKGITYDEFMKNKHKYKDARQLAKPINLGFPGGIGYDTMRRLLWSSGIKTKFEILHQDESKQEILFLYFRLRNEMPNIRVARLNKREWALVQDELVVLKREFFNLYPELENFLKDTHKKYLTKESKWVKNEFDEWKEEPMYSYNTHGFRRDWCTYTAFCNGFLMQSPSAVGAKKAVNAVHKHFYNSPDINPLMFIHDEIVFEVKEDRVDLIEEAANIMIEEMQSVLSSVRITVEASMSDFWQKADGFWVKEYWSNAR